MSDTREVDFDVASCSSHRHRSSTEDPGGRSGSVAHTPDSHTQLRLEPRTSLAQVSRKTAADNRNVRNQRK